MVVGLLQIPGLGLVPRKKWKRSPLSSFASLNCSELARVFKDPVRKLADGGRCYVTFGGMSGLISTLVHPPPQFYEYIPLSASEAWTSKGQDAVEHRRSMVAHRQLPATTSNLPTRSFLSHPQWKSQTRQPPHRHPRLSPQRQWRYDPVRGAPLRHDTLDASNPRELYLTSTLL